MVEVKTFRDAEPVVLGHQPGKRRFKGLLAALAVQLPDGTEFSVGTGCSEAQRAAPPPVGSVITFRYQELSDGGAPRFLSFVRINKPAGPEPTAENLPMKTTAPGVQADAAVAGARAGSAVRHFEFVEDKSSKFWEISVDGCEVTVRYGRIGAAGTSKIKSFADTEAAQRGADKLIAEKTDKGYVETGS